MSSAEKTGTDGAERFDADPEAWRKQFWENDGAPGPGDATAKPNGADSDDWAEPDMGVLRLRRRPPPALPLEVFGETWKKWLLDAAAAAACPVGRLCRRAVTRKRLDADRPRAVGAGLARMERTAASVDGGGWRQRYGQVPRRGLSFA